MLCFSGSTYQVIEQVMSNFGVAHISAETYYRFQSQYVIPAVERMYVNQERQVLNDMIERGMSFEFLHYSLSVSAAYTRIITRMIPRQLNRHLLCDSHAEKIQCLLRVSKRCPFLPIDNII